MRALRASPSSTCPSTWVSVARCAPASSTRSAWGTSTRASLTRTASTIRREIETLIETASSEHADVVIGSRFAGKGDYQARGPRKWAMNLFSFILSRVCKTHLSDTTSGFKLYGPRALSLFAHNYPAEYLGDTIGALVIAARSHLVVREVGVQMHPRAGGEPSHNPIKSALFLVRATLALTVALTRPGEKIAQAEEENA